MKKFGLIGYPLRNTFSENYFNSKFLALALTDYEYHNFPIENIEELPSLLNSEPDLAGFNVTIPYKEAILPLLDELDSSASNVGAVNCVVRKGNRLAGYNTDVYGFEMSLLPLIKYKKVSKALILGTGGAAKAVAFVLHKHEIPHQYVSRNPDAGQLAYDEVSADIISQHTLIINCTPVGMFPHVDEAPVLPYKFITPEHIFYDLIYLPVETAFLKHAKQRKATTKNGLEMLHLQAEKSWEIWKGNVR